MSRLVTLIRKTIGAGISAQSADCQTGRLRLRIDGLEFLFHESDGSLVGLRTWHRDYREGRLTDQQETVIDRHLMMHRRDCSLWDALTEEFQESVCDWLIEHRPDAVRRVVEHDAEDFRARQF